jgi:hypothetical protein
MEGKMVETFLKKVGDVLGKTVALKIGQNGETIGYSPNSTFHPKLLKTSDVALEYNNPYTDERLTLMIEKIEPHPSLTSIEEKLVEMLLEQFAETSRHTKSNGMQQMDVTVFTTPQGYKGMHRTFAFPVVLWLVETGDASELTNEILAMMFDESNIFQIDSYRTLILHEGSPTDPQELLTTLESDAMIRTRIAVGASCSSASMFHQVYQEMNVGFEIADKIAMGDRILVLENMKLAMSIYYWLKSVDYHLKRDLSAYLNDQELVRTVRIFLQSNLNITDAASKLYIHRNTLIYRLNRIETLTGYDLRKFEDALALVVDEMIAKL